MPELVGIEKLSVPNYIQLQFEKVWPAVHPAEEFNYVPFPPTKLPVCDEDIESMEDFLPKREHIRKTQPTRQAPRRAMSITEKRVCSPLIHVDIFWTQKCMFGLRISWSNSIIPWLHAARTRKGCGGGRLRALSFSVKLSRLSAGIPRSKSKRRREIRTKYLAAPMSANAQKERTSSKLWQCKCCSCPFMVEPSRMLGGRMNRSQLGELFWTLNVERVCLCKQKHGKIAHG